MLMPSKVKYRKQQRDRRRGKAYKGSTVSFGDFALKSMDSAWVTARRGGQGFAEMAACLIA